MGGPHLDSEMWETINPNPPPWISDTWETTNLKPSGIAKLYFGHAPFDTVAQ
jgi:hypothetical protein